MTDWREHARCRDTDPELHFPIGTSGPAVLQAEQAKGVCRPCPVKDECLGWALKNADFGIWGEMTEDERRDLKRRGRVKSTRGPVMDRDTVRLLSALVSRSVVRNFDFQFRVGGHLLTDAVFDARDRGLLRLGADETPEITDNGLMWLAQRRRTSSEVSI